MGGIHDFFGKDLQGGGLMMWSLPQGEVGGVKGASRRQSHQTTRFCSILPKFVAEDCKGLYSILIVENSGIGRMQASFQDAFIMYTVRIAIQ